MSRKRIEECTKRRKVGTIFVSLETQTGVCVYIYVCVYLCVYIYMCIHLRVYVYMCIYVCVFYVCIYVYVGMYV